MTLAQLKAGKVLLVDKPLDWTSFDVVNKLRWLIKKKYKLKNFKVGHAGTLDPKATGLLIICLGNETKNAEKYQAEIKTYTGTIKLGATTPSFDLETIENQLFETSHITTEAIYQVAESMIGEIMQVPPLFSAIKQEGKRLYELARKGKETTIKPRPIQVYYFKIQTIAMPFVTFEIQCSKGTYIRSIANEFGIKLNTGSYLVALNRVQSGNFKLENALSLSEAINFLEASTSN